LKLGNKKEIFIPFLNQIGDFLEKVACNSDKSEAVVKNCTELIGDLATTFPARIEIKNLCAKVFIDGLLLEAHQYESIATGWVHSVRKHKIPVILSCVLHFLSFLFLFFDRM
jgi:hypothetical protein